MWRITKHKSHISRYLVLLFHKRNANTIFKTLLQTYTYIDTHAIKNKSKENQQALLSLV